LKKSLYHVFSQFGNILEIQASKALKKRGQAWIVFDDLSSATKALKEMQGFMFYGKPMRVAYSKNKSDVVAKIDGTYKPRPKRKPEEKAQSKKGEPKEKKQKREEKKTESVTGAVPAHSYPAYMEAPAPPNKILFVENLPQQANSVMLSMLFDKYPGFKEARMVPGKPGIAFVEFEHEFQAAAAKDGLQNFKVTPEHLMKISFAKR